MVSRSDGVSKADGAAVATAVANNDATALRALLAKGIPCDHKEKFALQVQMANGQQGRTPEAEATLLHIACMNVAFDCVRCLLDANADATARIDYGVFYATPLDCCFVFQRQLQRGYALDVASMLISAKANPTLCGREPDGCTELILACQEGDHVTARFLLDHRADPSVAKLNGSGPLFKAAQNGHADICRLLINAHAEIDAKFQSGCTPLGAAAGAGHSDCMRVLLSANADPSLVASLNPPLQMPPAARNMIAQTCVSPPTLALPPGARVAISGIVAKPELNGQRGTVLEFDVTKGRCATTSRSERQSILEVAASRSHAFLLCSGTR